MAFRIASAKIPQIRDSEFRSLLLDCPGVRLSRAVRGTLMTHEGDFADHSMLLLEGWIALSKTLRSGETQIIDIMLPDDFALIGTRIAPTAACTVEALDDVEYILIQPSFANGSEAAFPHLREVMAAAIHTTNARTSELLLRLGRGNAANRIAYALLEFFVRLEFVGRTDGTTFRFPITQQKLGEFTGLSNVHVCRTLRRFERAGMISHSDRNSITLSDIDALCEIADIEIDRFREEILLSP